MNVFEKFTELQNTAQEILSRSSLLEELITNKRELIKKAKEDLEFYKKKKAILEESSKLMLEVIEKYSEEQLNSIRDVINSAIRSVFYNRNYEVRFNISDKRRVKNLEILLFEKKKDETTGEDYLVEADIADSVGGGVRAVVGVILRIFFISYFNLTKIMFLDEALAKISEVYIPYFLEFLKTFSVENMFTFVIITHDKRVMAYANTMYLVTKGQVIKK